MEMEPGAAALEEARAAAVEVLRDDDDNRAEDLTVLSAVKQNCTIFNNLLFRLLIECNSYFERITADLVHDADSIVRDPLTIPGVAPQSAVEFARNITLNTLRCPEQAANLLRNINTLLTDRGGKAIETNIHAAMVRNIPGGDLNIHKIQTFQNDDLDELTNSDTSLLRNAYGIIQDSISTNPFKHSKTNIDLIGAGKTGADALRYIINIILKLDGAKKIAESNIGSSMIYAEEGIGVAETFTVHSFIAGYRHVYRKTAAGDMTIEIYERTAAGAWERICTVGCNSGISINAICNYFGLSGPRGSGTGEEPISVTWHVDPARISPALILYIKTLTDWAQAYYCALAWHCFGRFIPLITVDGYLLRVAHWLRCPAIILMRNGYSEVYSYDTSAFQISIADKLIISAKLYGATASIVDVGAYLSQKIQSLQQSIASIPHLETSYDILSFFISTDLTNILTRLQTIGARITTDLGSIQAAGAGAPALTDDIIRRYYPLRTENKTIIDIFLDEARGILDVTQKYREIQRRILIAVSKWRDRVDLIRGSDDATIIADPTATTAMGNIIALMDTIPIVSTHDEFKAAWLTYLPLTEGLIRFNTIRIIDAWLGANASTIQPYYRLFTSIHKRFDRSGKPTIGAGVLLGKPIGTTVVIVNTSRIVVDVPYTGVNPYPAHTYIGIINTPKGSQVYIPTYANDTKTIKNVIDIIDKQLADIGQSLELLSPVSTQVISNSRIALPVVAPAIAAAGGVAAEIARQQPIIQSILERECILNSVSVVTDSQIENSIVAVGLIPGDIAMAAAAAGAAALAAGQAAAAGGAAAGAAAIFSTNSVADAANAAANAIVATSGIAAADAARTVTAVGTAISARAAGGDVLSDAIANGTVDAIAAGSPSADANTAASSFAISSRVQPIIEGALRTGKINTRGRIYAIRDAAIKVVSRAVRGGAPRDTIIVPIKTPDSRTMRLLRRTAGRGQIGGAVGSRILTPIEEEDSFFVTDFDELIGIQYNSDNTFVFMTVQSSIAAKITDILGRAGGAAAGGDGVAPPPPRNRFKRSISTLDQGTYNTALAAGGINASTFFITILSILDHLESDAQESGVGGAYSSAKDRLIDVWVMYGPTREFFHELGAYLYYYDAISTTFLNTLTPELLFTITTLYATFISNPATITNARPITFTMNMRTGLAATPVVVLDYTRIFYAGGTGQHSIEAVVYPRLKMSLLIPPLPKGINAYKKLKDLRPKKYGKFITAAAPGNAPMVVGGARRTRRRNRNRKITRRRNRPNLLKRLRGTRRARSRLQKP